MTEAPVREVIAQALLRAAAELVPDGPPDLEVGRSKNASHGDYSSPAGLKLARALRRAPAEIAAELAARISVPMGAAQVEAVGGYVNFRLSDNWLRQLVRQAAAAGPAFGSSHAGAGERVQVEFVSTNPTGPLHIGHGRGAILGDSLASLLAFTGHSVEREYYVNDYGTQAEKFAQSIYGLLLDRDPPAGGYAGDYVHELAREVMAEMPDLLTLSEAEALEKLRGWGAGAMVGRFRVTLGRLKVEFDHWKSERTLWLSGRPQTAIQRLTDRGLLVRREGATWFAPAVDDADAPEDERVVIRADGKPTYFASDLGYLLDRFESRAFNRVIEVWGADHHGYVPRMKSAMTAMGLDPSRLVIILNQLVNLKEGKMSKRQGRFVTLDELIDRVGSDAVRYFYLLRSPDAMMEFDLELATAQGNENPVYYAQYAHARLANLEDFAEERELPAEADLDLLGQPWELELAREIAFWPETVEEAARLLEPHRIPYYVQRLADRVHAFYQAGNRDWNHRVVVDDPDLTRARLELCRAARATLRNALDLVGVSAPDRM